MLLSRVGQKKQRLWPWFEPPVAEAPARYHGWFWDPANKEWLPTEVAPIKIRVAYQLYPKPTQMPSREFSSEQPGWSYDFKTYEWVRTYVKAEPVEFTPPRSLPPGINLASGLEFEPTDLEYILFMRKLLDGGMPWSAANDVIEGIRSRWTDLAVAKRVAHREEVWRIFMEQEASKWYSSFGSIVGYAIIILCAFGIGVMISNVAERVLTPDVDVFTLKEPTGTYLMRYDHYLYSKMVAISPQGKPYYSACDDIGTSYIRHRRAPRGSRVDIIDFPGGFVEEGHKGIYFVKYTWRAWTLEYIGFLTNVGGNFYVLREGNTDRHAVGKDSFVLDESEWCTGFRWYL